MDFVQRAQGAKTVQQTLNPCIGQIQLSKVLLYPSSTKIF